MFPSLIIQSFNWGLFCSPIRLEIWKREYVSKANKWLAWWCNVLAFFTLILAPLKITDCNTGFCFKHSQLPAVVTFCYLPFISEHFLIQSAQRSFLVHLYLEKGYRITLPTWIDFKNSFAWLTCMKKPFFYSNNFFGSSYFLTFFQISWIEKWPEPKTLL